MTRWRTLPGSAPGAWPAALVVAVAFSGPEALTAQAPDLQATASSLAHAWAGGNVSEVGRWLSDEGVHLTLLGQEYGRLGRRHALTALEDFVAEHPPRGAQLSRYHRMASSPDRGFAEIRLEVVVPGTAEVLAYTVFTELLVLDEAWRITDVRVLQ